MIPARFSRLALLTGIILICMVIGSAYLRVYDNVPYLPSSKPSIGGEPVVGEQTPVKPPKQPPAPPPPQEAPASPGSDNDQPWPIEPPKDSPKESPQEASPPPAPAPAPAKEPEKPAEKPAETVASKEGAWTPPTFGAHSTCRPELNFLRTEVIDLNLTQTVVYTRRRIKPVFSSKVNRDEVANITAPLIDHKTTIDLNACETIPEIPYTELELTVSNPYPDLKFPEFVFGIATGFQRLSDSLPAFAHWLADTDAELIVAVTDAWDKSREELDALEAEFAQNGVITRLVLPIDRSHSISQSHFTVLLEMMARVTPSTKWIGILDDDTFFPSLKPLSDALGTLDHQKDLYIGALSEDFGAVQNFGIMAFGGAGAFLSLPLAEKLANHMQECLEEATKNEGDIIIRDCVYTKSHAKLTQLPGLFQQDLMRDASGFFESGIHALSIHHWKSWYKEPIVEQAAVSVLCGDCFLQRWRFGQDNTVFTNGFSIAQYADGLDKLDLSKMEGTWTNWDNRMFDFSLGPLRPQLSKDQKKQYKMVDIDVVSDGNTKGKDILKQIYVHKHNPKKEDEIDEVVELVWER